MKRFRLLLRALVAVSAIAAAFSASAFALPELLGQAANAEYSGKSTAAELTVETTKSEKIACKEAVSEGVQETATLGTFHIRFTGCESFGFKCASEGDSTGTILSLGTFHYVYDTLEVELGIAILFLPEEQVIKCTALVTLHVTGTILCLVSEPFTSATTHGFQCSQSGGKPSEAKWWNDEGVEQNALLLTSKNGGAFVESAEQASASVEFGVSVAFEAPGKLRFVTKKGGPENMEEPLMVSVTDGYATLIEYLSNGLNRPLETKSLTVGITPGPQFKDNMSGCKAASLKTTEVCGININCREEDGEQGVISVTALPGVNVLGAQRKLKCVD